MNTSSEITAISLALALFQTKIGRIAKSSNNPFFKSKYAALPDILEAIHTPLLECGLVITQHPEDDNHLTTRIIHAETGQWIESSYRMTPAKNDPQGIGSCITYQRRYAIGSILSLNIDEDDDGNKASNNDNKPAQIKEPKATTPKPKPVAMPEIENSRVEKACQLIAKGDMKAKESLQKSFTLTMEQMIMVQDAEDLFNFNNSKNKTDEPVN